MSPPSRLARLNHVPCGCEPMMFLVHVVEKSPLDASSTRRSLTATTSERVTQRFRDRIRMKIARRRGPDKRTLIVLVIIPSAVPG